MTAFLTSLLFVALAEMGDKTQLLAMAFATRFRARTVLAAVFAATLVNHGLAVAAGRLLTSVIPVDVITLVAAFSFVLFGLWTIRGDVLEGEDSRPSAFGPFWTVAIAFFLAEMGDKTQLATISLAVRYDSPGSVLMGTTTGMVVADGIGILLGAALASRVPDAAIRLASAGVFVAFGLVGVGSVLPVWLPPAAIPVVLFGLAVATLAAAHTLFLQRRRYGAHPADAGPPANPPRQLSQLLFALILVAGWVASLGLAHPLAALDHWFAFALLAGLGWKLIHGAVRPRATPQTVTAASIGLILALAALTWARVVVTGVPWLLLIVPAGILSAAVLVLFGAPMLARRRPGPVALRMAAARVTIASGLLLVAIAVQILIEHLS